MGHRHFIRAAEPGSPGTDQGSTPGAIGVGTGIEGLSLETTYHYRLVAKNILGTTVGEDQSFTTPPAVAGVGTDEASSIGITFGTINGSFQANGEDTHYYFEWGPDTSYGTTTASPPGDEGGAQSGTTHVFAALTGLHYYTRYHYRLVASNAKGVTIGPDRDFVTLPPLIPLILTSSVAAVSPTDAMLETTVNPELADTVVRFQYGDSTNYGRQSLTSDSIGADETPRREYGDLEPAARDDLPLPGGCDQPGWYELWTGPTFTTPGPPRVERTTADAVGETTATIRAALDPSLRDTTYYVEYGTSAAYGNRTSTQGLAGSAGGSPVAVALSGLSAATTYHYMVVASNTLGTSTSPDQVFTTKAAAKSPPPPTAAPCRKGYVRRHGKCVKKHRHARRHHHQRGSVKHG